MTDPVTIDDAIEQIALGMVSSASENGRQLTQIPLRDLIEADKYARLKARTTATHKIMTSMQAIPPGGG